MRKSYIKQILSYSMVGSLGLTIAASLQGCGGEEPAQDAAANQKADAGSISDAAKSEEGMFLIIKQTGKDPDTYELEEKQPSSTGTRAILKELDGTERMLSEEELKAMAEAEAKRVEEGSSQLTQPAAENQGLSLGETILASAAGALIGGMIANKLMGNSNFQQHQQQQNQRAQSSMSRSLNNTNKAGAAAGNTKTQPKSGFFGQNGAGNSNPSNTNKAAGGTSGSAFGG